jgi:hypothetical protein
MIRSSPKLANGPILAGAAGPAYEIFWRVWITFWPVDNRGFVGAG